MADKKPNPLAAAVQQALTQIQSSVQQAGANAAQQLQAAGERAAAALHRLQAGVHAQLLGVQRQQAAAPMLASASAAALARRPQPVFELAFNPEEIKFRLAAIPVYAVVNAKSEFVLVSGDDPKARQLGLFFFSREEAEALVTTIREQNPKLGKQARVLPTSMDRVYEFAVTPRSELGLEGVVFRFVPDPQQVEAALKMYQAAGVPVAGFTGVPLFQAEGLTVKGESSRYTPLFFSNADLEVALNNAFLTKDTQEQAETRAKADRARSELQAAEAELAAVEGKARRSAQKKVDQASSRLQKYEQRLAEATAKKKLPRVDVGSLEEVIAKMESDEKGEWGDVMFIPSGALSQESVAQQR